jgi:hypothetical protein
MKLFRYPILGIAVLMAIVSCGGRGNQTESDSSDTFVPKFDRLVRANVEKVKTEPWDKSNYIEIRDNQIPKMKGRKKQSESLKLLKLNACLAMEKELNGLLESQCTKDNHSKNHTRMASLYNELTGNEFKDVDTGDPLHVRADYKTHQALFNQVAKQYASMKVSSFEDKYDTNYDNSVKSETKRMYDSNKQIADRCYYLKTRMTNVSFRERHKKYCEAIVTDYEKVTSWSEGNENIIQNRLYTFESEFRNSSDWMKWNDRVMAVKNKHAQ